MYIILLFNIKKIIFLLIINKYMKIIWINFNYYNKKNLYFF